MTQLFSTQSRRAQIEDDERRALEAEFLANIAKERATNPDIDQQYRELIPDIRARMIAIIERFAEPKDWVEEEVLHLARRELAFLASEEFKLGTLKQRTN
jgi:hypothetical protein